jgi:type IX secretion system PorP/SprF family membrane protein
MKKLLIGILLATSASSVFAQQDAQFTQFFRNKLNYNSALAGSEDGKICASLLYRTQWLGFGSKEKGQSPSTFGGNVHAPLLGGKLGLGLNIFSDNQGFESTLTPTISVAYHHTFQNQHKLSGGIGIGFIQKSLDGGKLKPQNDGDKAIPNSLVNGNALDLNFGIYYQIPSIAGFDKVYASLSLNQSRILLIHGPLGDSRISIQNGQVRFVSSPCRNQYCVHQGWLKHSGQVAICLPNQISLELLGADKPFDSLNY